MQADVLADLGRFGPVWAVRGNMDDEELQASLPEQRVVDAGGLRIGLVHDAGPRAGRHPRLAAMFPGCAAVVYGHTHIPEVERHAGMWILNPGSPTERRRAPQRSMLVAAIDSGHISPRLVALP